MQWCQRYNGLGKGEDWARAIAVDNSNNVSSPVEVVVQGQIMTIRQ